MIISVYAIPGKQFRDPLPFTSDKNTPAETVNKIKVIVLEFFNLDYQKVFSKRRSRELVLARQIMHYLARKYTKLSLKKIGAEFHHGKACDHTTIRHSIFTIQDLMDTDEVVKQQVEHLQQMMGLDQEEMLLLKNKTKFQPLKKVDPVVIPETKVVPIGRSLSMSEHEKTMAKYP